VLVCGFFCYRTEKKKKKEKDGRNEREKKKKKTRKKADSGVREWKKNNTKWK